MQDARLSLAPGIRGKIRKYGLFLYNPKTLWKMRMNRLGLEVIRRCDGTKSIVDLQNEVQNLEDFKEQRVTEDVFQLIAYLYTQGILIPAEDERGNRELYLNLEEFPLDLATIQLTTDCNLRCHHCYIEAGSVEKRLMKKEMFELIIDQLQVMHPIELVLTGGEPLLHPRLLEFCHLLKEKNLPFSLFTNGILITSELAEELGYLNPVSVQVSLDGITSETNDRVRGRGSFDKICSAIRALRQHGVRTVVSTVMSRVNYSEYREFPKFVEELGASSYNPIDVMLSGRADSNREDLGLTTEQVLEMQRYYSEYKSNNQNFSFGEISLKEDIDRQLEGLPLELCTAGTTNCFITAMGDVYPCQIFPNQFAIGNVSDQSLKDMWTESEIFQQIRRWRLSDIPECANCEVREVCKGGCIGYNLTINHGSFGIPERQSCEWKKIFYSENLS